MNANRVWLRSKAYRVISPGIIGYKTPGTLLVHELRTSIVHARTLYDYKSGRLGAAKRKRSDRNGTKQRNDPRLSRQGAKRSQYNRRPERQVALEPADLPREPNVGKKKRNQPIRRRVVQPREKTNEDEITVPVPRELPRWKLAVMKKKEKAAELGEHARLRAAGLPIPVKPVSEEEAEYWEIRAEQRDADIRAYEMIDSVYGSSFKEYRSYISTEPSEVPTHGNHRRELNKKDPRTWVPPSSVEVSDTREDSASADEVVTGLEPYHIGNLTAPRPPGKTILFPWLNSRPPNQNAYRQALTEELNCTSISTMCYSTNTFEEGSKIMELWHQSKSNDNGDTLNETIKKLITPEERETIEKEKESRHVQSGIYCHIMSNGGALAFLSYAIKWKVLTGETLPVFAMFIDSAPGWTTKTLEYLPSFGIDEEMIRKWIPILNWIPEALNDPSIVNINAMRQYVYSEADVVVDAIDVLQHSKNAVEAGYTIGRWAVPICPHVGIIKSHKAVYKKLIRVLWRKGVAKNPLKNDWVRKHLQWQNEETTIRNRMRAIQGREEIEVERAEAEARGEEYIPKVKRVKKVKEPKAKPLKPPNITFYMSKDDDGVIRQPSTHPSNSAYSKITRDKLRLRLMDSSQSDIE